MKTLTYAGQLSERSYGEADDILYLSTLEQPLGKVLTEQIAGKQVSVRYWITDRQMTKDEAIEAFLKTIFGAADAKFGANYSEDTGYLWTDEDLKIGGHDLMHELRSAAWDKKWLILEIDVHEGAP